MFSNSCVTGAYIFFLDLDMTGSCDFSQMNVTPFFLNSNQEFDKHLQK